MARPISTDLTAVQQRVALALADFARKERPAFVPDLAKALRLAGESSLAPTLQKMERGGFVEIQGGGVPGRSRLVRQFMTESVLISAGGGLLGIAFGFFLAWLIARTAEWKTIVTTVSVVVAFGVSVAVGVVFGVYPAVKASRINPIEALRYE